MQYCIYIGRLLDRSFLRQLISDKFQLESHEHLLFNASRYSSGDFLNRHFDDDTACRTHVRQRAFVWHLSQGFTRSDGGQFVDEVTNSHYLPQWNALCHFPVPRPHSVTIVTGPKVRYSIYGWIVTPKFLHITCLPQLLRLVLEASSSSAESDSDSATSTKLSNDDGRPMVIGLLVDRKETVDSAGCDGGNGESGTPCTVTHVDRGSKEDFAAALLQTIWTPAGLSPSDTYFCGLHLTTAQREV
jgi:2OG-Fe(II) oxygenase superfamily